VERRGPVEDHLDGPRGAPEPARRACRTPSGDQNGATAPSVPERRRAPGSSRDHVQRLPSVLADVSARRPPSGDTARLTSRSDSPSGTSSSKRTTGRASGGREKSRQARSAARPPRRAATAQAKDSRVRARDLKGLASGLPSAFRSSSRTPSRTSSSSRRASPMSWSLSGGRLRRQRRSSRRTAGGQPGVVAPSGALPGWVPVRVIVGDEDRSREALPAPVSLPQAHARLVRDPDGLVEGECTLGDAFLEVLAVDELEDEEGLAVRLLEPVNARDARVIERGEKLGLSAEPSELLRVLRHPGRKYLESDVPPELRVGGAVDRPLPPAPSRSMMR
jgi:hypothetical protein